MEPTVATPATISGSMSSLYEIIKAVIVTPIVANKPNFNSSQRDDDYPQQEKIRSRDEHEKVIKR